MTPLTIDFLGHSSFRFRHPASGTVYVDPWLTGNPVCRLTVADVAEASFVCVSHGHRDHLGDAAPICLKTGALLISAPEICAFAARVGVAYEKQSYGLNIGGTFRQGDFAVTMLHAFHTSAIQGAQYQVDRTLEAGGEATGFIFDFAGEHRVYFTGDTGVFNDMRLFAELYRPTLVILPIGGKYTMGIREAAKALELMQPPLAIPCHYDTYPNQRADLVEFERMVMDASPRTRLLILKPGEATALAGEATPSPGTGA
jgi:L-ascorbate metabolism protein UlaG (beta-lactamase superfamily)